MPPERRRLTAAKLVTLSAAILLVSLGLCGANFLLVVRFVPLAGPGPEPGQPVPSEWPGQVLAITGHLELAGIAVGIIGLIAAAFWRGRE